MLEVSSLGVGTLLRLERNAWSLVIGLPLRLERVHVLRPVFLRIRVLFVCLLKWQVG